MKARLPFLLYFIFFHSSNTTSEHFTSDAGGINDYFMRSANAKAGATTTATSAALRQQFLNSDFTTCPKRSHMRRRDASPKPSCMTRAKREKTLAKTAYQNRSKSEHFVQVRGPNRQRRIQLP